jgi:hypothetical protein
MKFNRILDVTESDAPMLQMQSERETNELLQYDETDLHHYHTHSHHHHQHCHGNNEDDYPDHDSSMDQLEHDLAILHPETADMFEDWKCAEIKVDEIVSDPLVEDERRHDLSPVDSNVSIESMDSFFKPEADQNGSEQFISNDVVEAMRRNNRDYITLTRAVEE